jgi:endonuclease V-like protein UPF0215 family
VTAGARAIGVAESYVGSDESPTSDGAATRAEASPRSSLAAAVVRPDRVVDGLAYGSCTVGGTDATAAIADCVERLDRPDADCVLVAGVALAWYNLVDLERLADAADRPVIAVSFEASDGLSDGLRRAFDGDALDARLAAYERLPERTRVDLDGDTVWIRHVGCELDAARERVQALTPSAKGRPEPLRVARLAARAADRWRRGSPA